MKKVYNLGARPPDKSVYLKIIFFISHSEHIMLCVLKIWFF